MKRNFPHAFRLHHAHEFSVLFRSRNRTENELSVIYCQPNSFGYSRLGIVLNKRIEPKAFKRNRAKRIIREMFRCFETKSYSSDFLIKLKKSISNDLEKQLLKQLLLEVTDRKDL